VLNLKVRRLLERNYQNIGTLPVVISRLLNVLNDPKSSAHDLAKIIAMDQVLSSRLLRMVNSAYYSLSKEVIDIKQAVGLAGYNVIRSFTFCITLFDSLFQRSGRSGKLQFDKSKFWLHSIAVGVLTRELAKRFRLPNPDDYFVAGVVHDIGKVFMLQFMGRRFFRALETANKYDTSFYQAEQASIDLDHTEVGVWVMSKWKLPNLLIDCAGNHHLNGIVTKGFSPPELVTLADNISKELKIGFGGDLKMATEYQLLKLKYDLDKRWIIKISEIVGKEIDDLANSVTPNQQEEK